jgi:hypothetical protein
MVLVATLANKNVIQDLDIFLFSLQLWSKSPIKIYIYCDTEVANWVKTAYPLLQIQIQIALDPYTGLSRKQMEQTRGRKFPSMWCDLMAEKIRLLEWIFKENPAEANLDGIFLMDADICFLGPLPTIPVGTQLALSPHEIRSRDTQKFGHYNGGFLWTSSSEMPELWSKATITSRYYEQAALEDIATHYKETAGLYEFPTTTNYGWWRLFQGEESAQTLQKMWNLREGVLCIGANPLQSIHTHWYETSYRDTVLFNQIVLRFLRLVAKKDRNTLKLVRHLEQKIEILRRF